MGRGVPGVAVGWVPGGCYTGVLPSRQIEAEAEVQVQVQVQVQVRVLRLVQTGPETGLRESYI